MSSLERPGHSDRVIASRLQYPDDPASRPVRPRAPSIRTGRKPWMNGLQTGPRVVVSESKRGVYTVMQGGSKGSSHHESFTRTYHEGRKGLHECFKPQVVRDRLESRVPACRTRASDRRQKPGPGLGVGALARRTSHHLQRLAPSLSTKVSIVTTPQSEGDLSNERRKQCMVIHRTVGSNVLEPCGVLVTRMKSRSRDLARACKLSSLR